MMNRSILLLSLLARIAQAQSIQGAVLAKNEPHHHLAYQDDVLRVLRVRVPARDTTLLHEHDPDYFWIALGASTVVNAKLGSPDATISSTDLSMHYTPGHFAHVARNPGTKPFDNITVELLKPQTNPRNLCEIAVANRPPDCNESSPSEGVKERPALATDQLRISLVSIDPGKTYQLIVADRPVWVIALDTADAKHSIALGGGAKWVGGTVRAAQRRTQPVRNNGEKTVRAIVVTGR